MNAYQIPSPPPQPEVGVVTKLQGPGEKKYSLWDLQQLIAFTQEKIQNAKNQNINVDSQVRDISTTIHDSPRLRHLETNEIIEVVLNRLIIVIGIYCNQVITKITKNRIVKLSNEGLNNPALSKKHGLIKQCLNWALRQLPEEISLKSPYEIDLQTRGLLEKVEDMKNKILR
jgi:hypothetical protein